MGTTTPLAIGTRGTIGSLVRREIDYFRRLELQHPPPPETSTNINDPRKPESKKYDGVSKSSRSKTTSSVAFPTLGSFLSLSWKKRGRSSNNNGKSGSSSSNNNSGRFLPSMCSDVEVCSESKRFGGIPGYTYRSLKTHIHTDFNTD